MCYISPKFTLVCVLESRQGTRSSCSVTPSLCQPSLHSVVIALPLISPGKRTEVINNEVETGFTDFHCDNGLFILYVSANMIF